MGLLDRYVNTLTDDTMGPYAMTEEDRKKLKKRGLLQFGLNLLANPTGQGGVFQAFGKAAAGAANDVQQGGQDMMKAKFNTDVMAQKKAEFEKQKLIDGLAVKYKRPDGSFDMQGYEAEYRALAPDKFINAGGNTELDTFRAMTKGLTPDEITQAQRYKLGLGARPSSAGLSVQKETGRDGRDRFIVVDPRTGQSRYTDPSGTMHGDPQGYAPEPTASPVSAPPSLGGKVSPLMELAPMMGMFGGQVSSTFRTASHNKKVGGVADSAHLDGTGMDVVFQSPQGKKMAIDAAKKNGFHAIDEGDHVHFQLRDRRRQAAPSGSITKAEEAAQVEAAKAQVQLETVGAIKTAEVTAAENAKNAATQKLDKDKKVVNAQNVLSLLSSAEDTLNSATASGFGAMRDSAYGMFGASTEGADATAALDVIAGQLVLSQPRMEGPQSDADRLLYAKMAGNLADNTKPLSQRKAAFAKMKELAQRYVSLNGPNAPRAPSGGMSIEERAAKYRNK